MLDPQHKKFAWIALILTAGEFTGAIILIVQEGHLFALYLALTYLVRETSGGKHYHDIVIETFQRVWRKPPMAEESSDMEQL